MKRLIKYVFITFYISLHFVSCHTVSKQNVSIFTDQGSYIVESKSINIPPTSILAPASKQQLDKEDFLADLHYLKYIIESTYVYYDYLQNNGLFDFQSAFLDLENSIDQKPETDFLTFTSENFLNMVAKRFEGLPDRHFNLSNFRQISLYQNQYFYGTGVLVEKEKEYFRVKKSSIPDIIQGQLLDLKGDQYFPWYDFDTELFQVGRLSSTNPQSIKVNLVDKQTPSIHIPLFTLKPVERKNLIKAIGKQVFLKLNILDESSPEGRIWFKELADFGFKARSADLILIDIRGHIGGNAILQCRFIDNYLGSNIENDLMKFFIKKSLYSPLTINEKIKYMTDSAKLIETYGNSPDVIQEIERFQMLSQQFINNPERVIYHNTLANEDKVMPSHNTISQMPHRKIIVLIDKLVGSAGEYLLLQLRKLPGTIVIGENTAGVLATGNPIRVKLPKTGLIIGVPTIVNVLAESLPNKVDLKTGIKPDYWVANIEQIQQTLLKLGVNEQLYIDNIK